MSDNTYRVNMRFGLPRIEPPKPGDLQRMQAEWAVYQYGLKVSDPAYIAQEKAEMERVEAESRFRHMTDEELEALPMQDLSLAELEALGEEADRRLRETIGEPAFEAWQGLLGAIADDALEHGPIEEEDAP